MPDSNSKIKVLEVVNAFTRGGTESFIINHLLKLNPEKYSITIAILASNTSPFEELAEKKRWKIEYLDAYLAKGNIINAFKQLYKYIKYCKFDIVHSHIDIYNAYPMLAAYLNRTKVRISHSHSSSFFINGNFKRRLYYNVFLKKIIALFATERCACSKEAGKQLYGKKPFKIIHNGIDLSRFQGDLPLPNDIIIPKNCKIYGSISRYDENKNLPFVVDIFNEIHKREPNSFLILGGVDGNAKEIVLQKIRDHSLSESVIEIGERSDVNQILHYIDCFIFPSKKEGLAIILLECQASGVHIVTSTGVPDAVDTGLNLIDYVDLSQPIAEWANISIKAKKKDIGFDRIKRAFTESNYDIECSVKELDKLYSLLNV